MSIELNKLLQKKKHDVTSEVIKKEKETMSYMRNGF